MRENNTERPLLWVASSKNDLLDMPEDVRKDFGYRLHRAQNEMHSDIGKIMRGFKGANRRELVSNHKGDTFRAVYTVRFEEVLVVLHAFQKKNEEGHRDTKAGH